MDKPYYKRVLIKLSGEALSSSDGILDFEKIENICKVIKKCSDLGTQIAIVVGGGNIWRGRQGIKMERTRADHMGMLATVINALAIQNVFENLGVDARVMSAVEMESFTETYVRDKAVSHLNHGRIVIFGCGLGSPFFSTDTASVVRAAEIGAEIALLAKNVDGVYTADPKLDPNATKIPNINYIDILKNGLAALDFTATSFSMENKIPILLFGLDNPDNIYQAVLGKKVGTIVRGD